MYIFYIIAFKREDKVEDNISDSNLNALLSNLKAKLPTSMISFSFFLSTYKGVLTATLASMLELTFNKEFNNYNLALEGFYSLLYNFD